MIEKPDPEATRLAKEDFVQCALETFGPEAAINAARLVGIPQPEPAPASPND